MRNCEREFYFYIYKITLKKNIYQCVCNIEILPLFNYYRFLDMQVLCLHLKRFRWINYYRTKIDTTVSFPVESLDMSEFVLRDIRDTRQSGLGCCLYDLAAIIVHHGSG